MQANSKIIIFLRSNRIITTWESQQWYRNPVIVQITHFTRTSCSHYELFPTQLHLNFHLISTVLQFMALSKLSSQMLLLAHSLACSFT